MAYYPKPTGSYPEQYNPEDFIDRDACGDKGTVVSSLYILKSGDTATGVITFEAPIIGETSLVSPLVEVDTIVEKTLNNGVLVEEFLINNGTITTPIVATIKNPLNDGFEITDGTVSLLTNDIARIIATDTTLTMTTAVAVQSTTNPALTIGTNNNNKQIQFSSGNTYASKEYISARWNDSLNSKIIGCEYEYYTNDGVSGNTTHSRLNFKSNNTLAESTLAGAGAFTMGTWLSNGELTVNNDLLVDDIVERTPAHGVWVNNTVLDNATVNTTTVLCDTSTIYSTLTVDTIVEYNSGAGVNIDGVLLRDNRATVSSLVLNSGAVITDFNQTTTSKEAKISVSPADNYYTVASPTTFTITKVNSQITVSWAERTGTAVLGGRIPVFLEAVPVGFRPPNTASGFYRLRDDGTFRTGLITVSTGGDVSFFSGVTGGVMDVGGGVTQIFACSVIFQL